MIFETAARPFIKRNLTPTRENWFLNAIQYIQVEAYSGKKPLTFVVNNLNISVCLMLCYGMVRYGTIRYDPIRSNFAWFVFHWNRDVSSYEPFALGKFHAGQFFHWNCTWDNSGKLSHFHFNSIHGWIQVITSILNKLFGTTLSMPYKMIKIFGKSPKRFVILFLRINCVCSAFIWLKSVFGIRLVQVQGDLFIERRPISIGVLNVCWQNYICLILCVYRNALFK